MFWLPPEPMGRVATCGDPGAGEVEWGAHQTQGLGARLLVLLAASPKGVCSRNCVSRAVQKPALQSGYAVEVP